jgi:hypothetical protein
MRCFTVWVALSLSSCTSYRDLLDRGHRLYQENEFGRALANWRALESDVESLSGADQARYAHLRGMTDLRLGYHADARHWLAIAQALDATHPGGLDARLKEDNEAALTSLNRPIYGLTEPSSVTESQP